MSEQEKEPLMITPGGGAFPFAVVGELEQAEQEPVAWYSVKGGFNTCGEGKPLYAAPVRTKDLTDDEIQSVCDEAFGKADQLEILHYRIGVARAVIAKFKEKNK